MISRNRNKYVIEKIQDFATRPDFRDWVLNPTPELEQYWNAWMRRNPNCLRELLQAKEIVMRLKFKQVEPSTVSSHRILHGILENRQTRPTANPVWLHRWWFAAAAVGLLVGFVVQRYYQEYSSAPVTIEEVTGRQIVTKENPRGRKSQSFFPDGSQVWLNAESKIQYTWQYSTGLREVRLEGEAYFDVVSDLEKPFTGWSGAAYATRRDAFLFHN